MPTGVAQNDLASLVVNQQKRYPFPDFFNTVKFSRYPFLNRTLAQRQSQDGGRGINFHVRPNATGNAKWTGPYATDDVRAKDVMIEGGADHAFADVYYIMDDREDVINQGPEKLVSTMQERRAVAQEDIANLMEQAVATVPYDSSLKVQGSNHTAVLGLPYWFCMGPSGYDAGATVGDYTAGFVGDSVQFEDETTSQTIGRIARGTYSRLRNYAFTRPDNNFGQKYVDDFRAACVDVMIRPPTVVEDKDSMLGSEYATYCNRDSYIGICAHLDSKNSNFGNDLHGVKGTPVFMDIPYIYTPSLNKTSSADTQVVRRWEPMYTCAHDERFLRVSYLGDRWMKEYPARQSKDSHNIVEVWVDYSVQIVVANPRYSGFVCHFPRTT